MRTLSIIIDSNGRVKCSGTAGFRGEHNAVRIMAKFSDAAPDADYYRMIFSSSDEKKTVTSGQLLPLNFVVTYNLPSSVTSLGPTVIWQLFAYKVDGSTVKTLTKTETVMLNIGTSLDSSLTEAGTELASDIEKAANKVEAFSNGIATKYSTDFAENDFYGNNFGPPTSSDDNLVISKVGNVVTVCGAVKCTRNAGRGHVSTTAEVEIIYLPFMPAKCADVMLFNSTLANGTGLQCRTNNKTGVLQVVSGSMNDGQQYRLNFSYVSKS